MREYCRAMALRHLHGCAGRGVARERRSQQVAAFEARIELQRRQEELVQ